MTRRRLVVALLALLAAISPAVVLADDGTGPTHGKAHWPTPENWQGWAIVLAPLAIAVLQRLYALFENRRPTRFERKVLTNVCIALLWLAGLLWTHSLDDFEPSFAAAVLLVIGVHVSYDKFWLGVPGLKHLIVAIDPVAQEALTGAPVRTT